MKYDNIYVASFNKNEIFNLSNLTFQTMEHNFEPGEVVKLGNNVLSYSREESENELTEEEKKEFDQNKELLAILNKTIKDNCTGKIVYDVAWWAMDFNRFMRGFCTRHFEV